jgi:hypothetical protein
VAFDIHTFLREVKPSAIDGFLERYGKGQPVDWQLGTVAAANAVLEALDHDAWAISALENCELIAVNGGRDLLRSAGHRRPELMPGVDNLDVNNETCAVWLATQDREIFDHIVSAAHALKGLGTRSWDAFRITRRQRVTAAINDTVRLGEFKAAIAHVLKQHDRRVPAHRTFSIGHFEYALPSRSSHSRRPWTQVNVYAQTAPQAHEILVNDQLRRISLPGLYRASIIFDPTRSTIEVVAKGGRPVRDDLVDAFCRTFLPSDVSIERLARRQINFELFASKPSLDLRPGDPVSDCAVDEIRLVPSGSEGGLITLECKRQAGRIRDIYTSAAKWFGDGSPVGKVGWQIVGVRLRLTFKPDRLGKSARIVTIELKSPMGTSLRENTDADHAVAEKLFSRWQIFGPEPEDE